MSMKILSPAGDMESLKTAVFNGADEVYLGVKDFNARNIEGFSLSSLKEAVNFAHIYGVKINLTVNILFKDEELQSALDLVVDAYNLGVDSFIIQDLGLASLIHEYYPQIEMHASTQMGLHNLEGVLSVEKLGFKRVVLARETPLEEIKRIRANTNVEIEYFCQGALCVSFSGNCYLSSYLLNASGNRGKCKQLCRLPYSFMQGDKEIAKGYLLSAKDFKMLNNLKDLQDAGVNVLKIEGRARRPYYVGVATRVYKQAVNCELFDENELKLAFNRGYTAGYFNGNGEIISNIQNHIGIEIGKVKKFVKGKKFNEIFIKTDYEISPKSTLKFFKNETEDATISAFDISKINGLTRITTTQVVESGNLVNIISDQQKEDEMLRCSRKVNVNIVLKAVENEHITAKVNIKGEQIVITGDVCLEAKNRPISKEDLEISFAKHSNFSADLNCELGNVFLTKKQINEFRRTVYEKVEERLTSLDREELNKVNLTIKENNNELKDWQMVDSLNFEPMGKYIIYSPECYEVENIFKFVEKCEYKKAILNLPNFALAKDIEFLKRVVKETGIAVMVNNLYGLGFDCEKFIGGGMNVFNSVTADLLNLPYVVAEGSDFKMPFMTLRHCPIKAHVGRSCADCRFKQDYEYKMQNGKRIKLKRIKMSDCTFLLTE